MTPRKLNILLLGSGGRECAIAWRMAQSSLLGNLYIAPGNAGTARYGTNLSLDPCDFAAVGQAALENHIDMLVVGSEAPLVAGIADHFHATAELSHIAVIGPGQAAAQLEGSKEFAKRFMLRHDIPTARHLAVTADNLAEGLALLDTLEAPYVLKADGLAAGKGVLIIDGLDQAKQALKDMLGGMFGDAGNTVVIEEYLYGVECSAFVITDGKDYRLLSCAKDYKRVGEGDTGPNTGGMGSVSPPAFITEDTARRIEERVIRPTIEGLRAEGLPYCGFIFFGLMIDYDGNPKVIEYNVRLGDPETESLMPRLKTDLVELLHASAVGRLGEMPVEFVPDVAATVILVSDGYPGAYRKGLPIIGLNTEMENVVVFHAGTKADDGRVVTSGGRVLAVTALAPTLPDALTMAYRRAGQIRFEGVAYRRDIGSDIDDPYANRTPDFVRRAKNQATLYTADYNTKHNRN